MVYAMFSELYGLAETSVSQTEAPVNTPAQLASLPAVVKSKLTLSWNNQFYPPYVTNLLLLSNVLQKSVVHNIQYKIQQGTCFG